MSDLKKTPLHQAHVDLGARMVDFGGWSMPINYGSQIEEHHAVRQDAGMFDVSHMQSVDVTGAGALAFLRRLLANDVNKILGHQGKALYTCMLNPEGGIIDDLIVYYFADDHWRLVLNAACAEGDVAWMTQCQAEFGAETELRVCSELAMIAVQGPNARAKLWQARPDWQAAAEPVTPFNSVEVASGVIVARTGYTGEDGVEIMLPADQVVALWQDLLAAGVKPCGLGARDTLRLEAGMNLYGNDMDSQTQPGEAGLNWTVDRKDESRDFVGREALTSQPRRQAFLGVKLKERGVMRAQMPIRVEAGSGVLTSGTMSPTLGFSIGMARLPEGVKAGESAEVEIRGKWVPATLVALPFVRQGKALVS